MLRLKLNNQVDILYCARCHGDYQRVYGSFWEDEEPLGVYSADLHQKALDHRVLLAIGIRQREEGADVWRRWSVVIEVWPSDTEYQMAFRDAVLSPYRDSGLLGAVLDAAEARTSPLRDSFLHAADHIVTEDPRVRSHLG